MDLICSVIEGLRGVDTFPFWTNLVGRFWFIRPKTANLLTMAWEGRDIIQSLVRLKLYLED